MVVSVLVHLRFASLSCVGNGCLFFLNLVRISRPMVDGWWQLETVAPACRIQPSEEIMDAKYVVLKNKRLMTGDPFAQPFAITSPRDFPSPEFTVEVSDIKKRELAERSRDPEVVAIAPAMPMKLIAPRSFNVGNEAEPANQHMTWGVQAVGADTSPFSGAGTVVAVLDTGIDAAHPAFNGVQLVQKDFTGEGDGDLNGHGTHCAGTIFGRNVNGKRIGVAPGINKALIGKVLGRDGGGTSDQICNAILWAIDSGANVISMSLGMDFPGYQKDLRASGLPEEVATSIALEGYRKNVQLFERLAALIKARSAFTQGAVIVAAAGNESNRAAGEFWEIAVSPPAIADGIISVGAIGRGQQGFTVAPFSNTGANICGPGVDVVSAAPGGGLRSLNGTSMATPHIAGAAALWAEKLRNEGNLVSLQLTARLLASARTEGFRPEFDPLDIGAGLVRSPQQE
jgi:hypothetical protein